MTAAYRLTETELPKDVPNSHEQALSSERRYTMPRFEEIYKEKVKSGKANASSQSIAACAGAQQ